MDDRKYSHYYKDVSKLNLIDVYRVLKLWEVSDPCLQHAIKKLLVAGGRGSKDFEKDLLEAKDSIGRALEMGYEDGALEEDVKDNQAFKEFMGVPLIYWPKLLRIPRDKDETHNFYLKRLSKVVVHEVLEQPHPCPSDIWIMFCNGVRGANRESLEIKNAIDLVTKTYYDKT